MSGAQFRKESKLILSIMSVSRVSRNDLTPSPLRFRRGGRQSGRYSGGGSTIQSHSAGGGRRENLGDAILFQFFPPIRYAPAGSSTYGVFDPDSLRSCGACGLGREKVGWRAGEWTTASDHPSPVGRASRPPARGGPLMHNEATNPSSILPPVQAWGKLLGREGQGRLAAHSGHCKDQTRGSLSRYSVVKVPSS